MSKSLLEIVVIHDPNDRVSESYFQAVTRGFEYQRPDHSVSQVHTKEDPWERVTVLRCTSPRDLEQALVREETRTLYLILITDALVNHADFRAALEDLAATLPTGKGGRRDAICYSHSETAVASLPQNLSRRQIRNAADLGERGIRPFRLTLQLLHRARILLGEPHDNSNLKFFLSHAKADGVFFAQALKHSIDQTPQLTCFYDDTDLQSGSSWADDLKHAASNGVMIVLRTPAYEQRWACRQEFETALLCGVPIVVVDGMSMASVSSPSHLPFAAMRDNADHQEYWLIPQSHVFDAELQATKTWLNAIQARLKLEVFESFYPVP